jgi:DNA-directed RNA polymerase subunit beta
MKSHGVKTKKSLSLEELHEKAREVMAAVDKPMPTLGKLKLRDGKTGEYYDHPVTVGLDDSPQTSPSR